jgi:hypothetical protein
MIQLALLAYAAKKLGNNRLVAISRTAAYVGVVLIGAGGIGMHKARAAVAENGIKLGDDLAAMLPLLKDGSTLNVNGQRVHFASARTLEGTHAVLDKFQSSCESGEPGSVPVWNALPDPTDPTEGKKLADINKLPVLRNEQGQKGFIVCMIPSQKQTADGFKASLIAFMEHHASLQLGKLRYAKVEEDATGSNVVTVWTDENFDIAAFVPADASQDTQGIDPGIMSRPEKSTRLLSGIVENLPYKVFLYQTSETPKEAIDAYDTQMIAKNWVSVTAPQMAGTPHEGFEAHAYMRDGFVGYVTTSKGPTGQTIIGVGETAGMQQPDKNSMTVKDSDGF